MDNQKIKDNTLIEITQGWVQEEAEQELNRQLTKDELEEVEAIMGENLWMFIRDNIREVISHRELVESNKNSRTIFPHYEIWWYDESAKKYQYIYSFKMVEEAHRYIHYSWGSHYLIKEVTKDTTKIVWETPKIPTF